MKRVNRFCTVLVLLLMLGLLAGCGGSAQPAATPTSAASPTVAGPTIENPLADLSGGVLAEFIAIDETFTIWVTNPQTARQIVDLLSGQGTATIPSGPVLPGPGLADHNEPYTWHLDPEQTVLVEQADVACNLIPSLIENDVNRYIAEIGTFCPSTAILLRVLDLR